MDINGTLEIEPPVCVDKTEPFITNKINFGWTTCTGNWFVVLAVAVNAVITFLRALASDKISQKRRELLSSVKKYDRKKNLRLIWKKEFNKFMQWTSFSSVLWLVDIFLVLNANAIQLIFMAIFYVIVKYILYKTNLFLEKDLVDSGSDNGELSQLLKKKPRNLLDRLSLDFD